MFIPYKDMFEPPTKSIHVHNPVPRTSWKFDWKILLIILVVIGLGLAAKVAFSKPRETSRDIVPRETSRDMPREIRVVREVPQVPKEVTRQVQVKQSVAPLVTSVPAVIEFKTPQDLARGVGTELRDVLLKHKQIPSLAVAGIVSNAVRTLLGEDERPEPPEPKPESIPEPKEREPKPEPPKAPEDEPEVDPPKRGKINADTDPALLKLLKERGLN